MRRLTRPPAPPEPLPSRGVAARAALEAAYRRGVRDFVFDDTIWRDPAVKEALRRMQLDKCAFCESAFAHISYGDVEHFRPKAEVRQDAGGVPLRPGYYWLAYEWSNLFVSCQLCNQRFKRTHFPLSNPGRRARSHRQNLGREKPLLINPAAVDPALHITFHDERPVPVGRSRVGDITIRVLGLDRPELLERRRERLQDLKDIRDLLDHFEERERAGSLDSPGRQLLTRLRGRRDRALRPEAEYSAMAAAFFSR